MLTKKLQLQLLGDAPDTLLRLCPWIPLGDFRPLDPLLWRQVDSTPLVLTASEMRGGRGTHA